MTDLGNDLFILYQMGASEEWTWFSVVGVFFSEGSLLDYATKHGIQAGLVVMEPSSKNEVVLVEPREYVVVRSGEGEVPEVELAYSQ